MPTSPTPPPPTRSPSPPDIAAAMGFASFGAKPNPPKKKRKIAGSEVDGEASGSNNTPLGMRARVGKAREGDQVDVGLVENKSKDEGNGDLSDEGKALPLVGGERFSIRNPASTAVALEQQGPLTLVHNPGDEELLEAARERGLRRLEGMARGGGEGRRADGEWDWNALRRGVRDERGDMAFYDASFVEDPWRHLRGKGCN